MVRVKPYYFKWNMNIVVFAELFSVFNDKNILMYLCSSTLKQDNKINYLEGQVCTLMVVSFNPHYHTPIEFQPHIGNNDSIYL